MKPGTYVYFVKPTGFEGPIKIGCSHWPEDRLLTLMSWSPFDLELLVKIPGDFQLERRIQTLFRTDHIRHEWFRPNQLLVALVGQLKAGVAIDDACELPERGRPLIDPLITPDARRRTSFNTRLHWAVRRLDLRLPDDVHGIMARWSPYARPVSQAPSAVEIARLEQVIAHPAEHGVPRDAAYRATAA